MTALSRRKSSIFLTGAFRHAHSQTGSLHCGQPATDFALRRSVSCNKRQPLQKKAALGATGLRTLYNKETDAVLAESKDPQRASVRIANEINAAKALRDALRVAGGAK